MHGHIGACTVNDTTLFHVDRLCNTFVVNTHLRGSIVTLATAICYNIIDVHSVVHLLWQKQEYLHKWSLLIKLSSFFFFSFGRQLTRY